MALSGLKCCLYGTYATCSKWFSFMAQWVIVTNGIKLGQGIWSALLFLIGGDKAHFLKFKWAIR